MRRPRFHLATFTVASLTLTLLLGANLRVRTSEVLNFISPNWLQEQHDFSQSSVYRGNYGYSAYESGWPISFLRSREIMASVDVFSRGPVSAQEILEVERPARAEKKFDPQRSMAYRWDAAYFQELAPTIYRNIVWINEKPTDEWHAKTHFISIEQLKNWSLDRVAFAKNTAVALSITLAVAALCELFLRRKKERHRFPVAFVLRTT